MPFVPLHCHSEFSFHAGVPSVAELVSKAKALGYTHLALTDTNRMSGLILFYLECKKQGIEPILGTELTEPSRPNRPLVLLAQNSEGYSDVCDILSDRHLNKERFSFHNLLTREWPNLIFFSAEADHLELFNNSPNKKNCYAELIRHSTETRIKSRAIETLADSLGVSVVAATPSFFLEPSDYETHKVLTAIGLNASLSRLKKEEYAEPSSLLPSSETMQKLFSNRPDALLNSKAIAARCKVELHLNEWIMPEIKAPEGHSPESWLKTVADQGLERHYHNTPEYQQALTIQREELATINKLGYASYFLMVKEIREWANNHFKSRYRKLQDCTILRGSAANSITFYNIGVSDLDPIRYNLYFQRFLNEDRASPPDADLDFAWDERDEVLEFMVNRFGRERVAITCTTNRFRRRAAFRETAKVFGYSEEQVSELLSSFRTHTGKVMDDHIAEVNRIAATLQGKPRFLGQHPGGVLITNNPIRRRVACEYSGGGKNRIITQIDMHSGIDELGLIKFDLLGNGSLAVLRDTLSQLEAQGLLDPKVDNLEQCYHDSSVHAIMERGLTRGIFYIESPAQIRLNQKAQAETFEEITVTSSLVRPAGAKYTEVFVERHRKMKMGVHDWDFLHPSLEPILHETHDVLAFQEDVTKVCHQVAGLSYKTADKIRKMMNSLHEGLLSSDEWHATCRAFMEGCKSTSGLTEEQARELWERVSSFTGFSFCKSHSASYAQLSFQCAYLKTRYPAQFLAAVISNNHGFYNRSVYLNEARRWNLSILPIHINESNITYTGKHQWIRPGLQHIKGIRRDTLDAVIKERHERGCFRHLPDFLERLNPSRSDTDKLIRVGAFDGFGLSRPELLFLLDEARPSHQQEQLALFSLQPTAASLHPGLTDYSFFQKCLDELELLGYMLSGNILDILELHPAGRNTLPLAAAAHHQGERVTIFGMPVTERLHVVAKTGEPMEFLTLEDKSGCLDIIFWPDIFEQFHDTLLSSGPFQISGRITESWGTFCLEADHIRAVSWMPNQLDFALASRRLEASNRSFRPYDDLPRIFAA